MNIFGHYSKLEIGILKALYEEQGLTRARKSQLRDGMCSVIPVGTTAMDMAIRRFNNANVEVSIRESWGRTGRKRKYVYNSEKIRSIMTSTENDGSSRGNKEAFKLLKNELKTMTNETHHETIPSITTMRHIFREVVGHPDIACMSNVIEKSRS